MFIVLISIMGNILTNRRTGSHGANFKFLPIMFFVSQNFLHMLGQKNLHITFCIMKLSYEETFISGGSTVYCKFLSIICIFSQNLKDKILSAFTRFKIKNIFQALSISNVVLHMHESVCSITGRCCLLYYSNLALLHGS